ncbi:TPA: prepilin-type N-terminal cleavage/methylation domain-containing protein [Salmonella enterica subsp. salamae serovar 56:l,v:z39]|nr:prepilin-type N-terminal cleavage/methylation domain-containing protein [Salmonella enterica subsp. salamae serovar 56:l,v:z39]
MYKVQRGLTLIEAAMVLALAAIVISGAMYYYQSAKENENRNEVMTTVMNIIATVNKIYTDYGFHKPYTGLSTELIQEAIPNLKLDKSTGYIIQPDGISIGVEPMAQDGGYLYRITLYNVPYSQCSNYSTMLTAIGGNFKKAWIRVPPQPWIAVVGTPQEVKDQLFQSCQYVTTAGTVTMGAGLIT